MNPERWRKDWHTGRLFADCLNHEPGVPCPSADAQECGLIYILGVELVRVGWHAPQTQGAPSTESKGGA